MHHFSFRLLFPFFHVFTITLAFITNVATIPQKENKFLTKAVLFIAVQQHFGDRMHLPIEFLIFIMLFCLIFPSVTFTQNIPQLQKVRLFATLRTCGFRCIRYTCFEFRLHSFCSHTMQRDAQLCPLSSYVKFNSSFYLTSF